MQQIIKKAFCEKISQQEIKDLNLAFQQDESNLIQIFKSNFNQFEYESLLFLFDNLNLLSQDASYILELEASRLIVNYFVNNSDKTDFFKLILVKKSLNNRMPYLIEDEPAEKIISFYQELSQYNNLLPVQEYYNCLYKIASTGKQDKACKIINLLNNEEKYYIHVNACKNNCKNLFFKLDNYLKYQSDYWYYLFKNLNDDSELCHTICKLDLNNINDSQIKKILLKKFNVCRKTVLIILNRAVEESNCNLVIFLSEILSKKETLNYLLQIGDNSYIKSYLDQNKNIKEIKDLMIYY